MSEANGIGVGGDVDAELAAVGALLVDDRVLRRIIKRHRGLAGLGLQVPHAHSYALPRAELAPMLDPGDVVVDLATLPDRVVLITGDRGELALGGADAWTAAWRASFHAHVHQALDERRAAGALELADVRARIHAIGQVEFDEVRLVLRQEDALLPPADDATAYAELVALYLELHHFAPRTLAHTFPQLAGQPRVVATLALDVDGAAVLAASRPARAPRQPVVAPSTTQELAAVAPRVASPTSLRGRYALRAAEAARARGNLARAAILAERAGAPDVAAADLTALVARLAAALGAAPPPGWAEALAPVARAASGDRVARFSAGARLLHDLQAACLAAEREHQIVDGWRWALSAGRRAAVRALPATREIRVARHVHGAAKKLARCAVASTAERARLAEAVHAMVALAEQRVRDVLRPRIEEALVDVDLRPRHLPELVAQKKIVDELLDHAVAVGRLSLGNLRDAIAHNDLKLPDLRPTQLATGDQLLRMDRLLAGTLDGVYRRGEIYMRWLQKLSSVLSGTGVGRLLTLYLLLPVVGSFFVVEGLQHMVGPAFKLAGYVEPRISTQPAFIAMAVVVFLLLHSRWFRGGALAVARAAGRGLAAVFVDAPAWLWRVPGVRPVTRWVILPGAPAALCAWLVPGVARWPVAGAVLVVTAIVINSAAVEERISDWLVRSGRHLSRRVLPGLVKWAIELFAYLIELLERGIYRVDEALRFRTGQSRVMTVIKGVLGALWFVVAYVLRLYVNLFVEPTVNPIKHFPVVTVAAKVILPFTPQMVLAISAPASGLLGDALGASFAAFTVLVLPGLAGFLAWELNGNWKLYRRTRPEALRPVAIGSHGETMLSFLRPGFHSGTIPKLHGRLRRAAAKGDERGVARHTEGLHHCEEAIEKFADRQLVSMLNEAPSFRAVDVAVAHVHIGSNRVRIELACPSVGPAPALLAFEFQSGWLVAGIPEAGWLAALDATQREIFAIALAGFYKLSGVGLVREQLEDVLRDGGDAAVPPYDVADDGLVVWPGPGFATEQVHPLEPPTGALAARRAVFGDEPITWIAWENTWERLAFGMTLRPLLEGPGLLPPAAAPAPAAPAPVS